jgi:hypothetical protein
MSEEASSPEKPLARRQFVQRTGLGVGESAFAPLIAACAGGARSSES